MKFGIRKEMELKIAMEFTFKDKKPYLIITDTATGRSEEREVCADGLLAFCKWSVEGLQALGYKTVEEAIEACSGESKGEM